MPDRLMNCENTMAPSSTIKIVAVVIVASVFVYRKLPTGNPHAYAAQH